jgi:hypothetical protein
MGPILLALLLQSPPPTMQAVDLPVSLERIREGLARPPRFDPPRPRPGRTPVFRVKVEQIFLEGHAWQEKPPVAPWVQPLIPLPHVEFLEAVTPEEVRASTMYPCCTVTPIISAVKGFIDSRVRASREKSAKREVEEAMRAAGIRR